MSFCFCERGCSFFCFLGELFYAIDVLVEMENWMPWMPYLIFIFSFWRNIWSIWLVISIWKHLQTNSKPIWACNFPKFPNPELSFWWKFNPCIWSFKSIFYVWKSFWSLCFIIWEFNFPKLSNSGIDFSGKFNWCIWSFIIFTSIFSKPKCLAFLYSGNCIYPFHL